MEIRYSSPREVVVANQKKLDAPPLKTMLLDPDVRNFFKLVRDNQHLGFRQKAIELISRDLEQRS